MRQQMVRWLYGATVLVTLLAGAALFVPSAGAAEYSAGVLRTGTQICRCPVLTGDCVCEWHTP